MRAPAALATALLAAGCLGGFAEDPEATAALDRCRAEPAVPRVAWFGPGHTLVDEAPAAGSEAGNAFSSAFLTDWLKEWLSGPVAEGLWIDGDVTLEYWVRSTGTPAPVLLGGGPGEAYRFFAQFGSDRSLQPATAREHGGPVAPPGRVERHVETLAMPPGGFVVEPGDRLRVILTDLALDGPGGAGHDVLFGGDTPSQVRFSASCFPDLEWESEVLLEEAVSLPANRGLLTGAVPAAEGVNQARFDVDVPDGTGRLSVALRQGADANPVKDDADLVLLDAAGRAVWPMGSPHANEAGALWGDNLAALFPDGRLTVQVESYSGLAYEGRLTVTAEAARAP